jgi:hypothetical protein
MEDLRVDPYVASGAGLVHCPSGDFNANAYWGVLASLAHNTGESLGPTRISGA